MAARLNNRQSEQSRAAIQTTQLIKRLQQHALDGIELSNTQIRAIEILLNKTIPNLSATQVSGDADSPLQIILQSFADAGKNT